MSKVIPFIYEDRDELYANTYVLIDDDNNCVVIDPAKAYDGLVNYIKKNNLTLKGVLLTHGHADHIRGVDTLVNAFNAPVYIDISYENEISINDDNVDSFSFYRIIYTYDNKFNNKLTYHIKNDSIGYNYYNMPVDDMRELEMILKIKFTNE